MSNLRQTQDFFFKACALALQAIPPRAKLSARWLSQEAKRLGFLARSAFKLQEIQDKHRVIPRGGHVLDLGCSPGAWLQVACRSLGPEAAGGSVLGFDLQEVVVPSLHCDARVRAICGDALELTPEALRALQPRGFSALLSDMCPATTGSGSLDATRSAVLAEAAVELALGDFGVAAADRGEENAAGRAFSQGVLLQGGALVVKLLEGDGGTRQELNAICRLNFARVAWMRPKATRSISREVYLVALGRQLRRKGV